MKLQTLNCGLPQHNELPVVGTRTLAYQYFAKFENEEPIWLGLRSNSDYDYFSNTLPKAERIGGDFFRGTLGIYLGFQAPYKIGPTLYQPNTRHYLFFSITKRIFKTHGTMGILLKIGSKFILADEDGCDLMTMRYYPVPQSLWIRASAFANHRNDFLEILRINSLT